MDGSRLFTFIPIKHILAAAALAGAIACMGTAGLTQTGVTMIAIDKMIVGAAPADFEFARTGQGGPAQWTVAADATASGGRAIEQTSTDRTDYRFPLAIYQKMSARNADLTVHFKAVAGKVDQAGGIAVRLTGPNDYYLVRANALENNVRFYRVQNGSRRQLDGVSAKVAHGQWHTLGVRAEGALFTVTFDGLQLFIAEDNGYADIGRVALWTKADSVTFFDAIKIEALR